MLGPQGLLLDHPRPREAPDTHDPVFEGDQLLFLFLAVLEMRLNQRLQLVQVLLHALPVDVLRGGGAQRLPTAPMPGGRGLGPGEQLGPDPGHCRALCAPRP